MTWKQRILFAGALLVVAVGVAFALPNSLALDLFGIAVSLAAIIALPGREEMP